MTPEQVLALLALLADLAATNTALQRQNQQLRDQLAAAAKPDD